MSDLSQRVQELSERLDRIEQQLDAIEKKLQSVVVYAVPPKYVVSTPVVDCDCPVNSVCMNTACPRRVVVTSGTDGVGWPD
jgi:hypothetical protein